MLAQLASCDASPSTHLCFLASRQVHVSKGVRPRVTNVDQAESLHRQLFDGFDYHRALGAAETDSQAIGDALSDGEWFYGEFTYESFAEMLRQVGGWNPDA